MSELGTMLEHLAQEDVKELLLRAGSRPTLRYQNGDTKALPGAVLNFKTMLKLVGMSPIAKMVPTATASGLTELIELGGSSYAVTMIKRGVDLQVRVRRPSKAPPKPRSENKRLQLKTPEPEKRQNQPPPPEAKAKPNKPAVPPPSQGGDDALARLFGRSLATGDSAKESAPAQEVVAASAPPPEPAPSAEPAPPARTTPMAMGADPGIRVQPATSARRQMPASDPAPEGPVPEPTPHPVEPPPRRRKATTKPGVEPPQAQLEGKKHQRHHTISVKAVTRRRTATSAKQPHPHLVSSVGYGRQLGASDIIMAPGRPLMLRRAGLLEEHGEALPPGAVEQMLDTLMTSWHSDRLDRDGYVALTASLQAAGRVRVRTSLSKGGLQASLRVLPIQPIGWEQLGIPATVTEQLEGPGLVLVTSPSGHGKSTTLASLVNLINSSRRAHILVLSDNVEVLHPIKQSLITQREVGVHCVDQASGIRGARGLDADVIAIDELRDGAGIEAALAAAQSGRLVLAAMSAPSGMRAIDTLLDRVEQRRRPAAEALLAATLRAVVFQRLLTRADGEARVVASEIVLGVGGLGKLIRERKLHQLPTLVQRGKAFGMRRLSDSVAALLRDGLIDAYTARPYLAAKTARKALKEQAKAAPPPKADPASDDGQDETTPEESASLVDRVGGLFGIGRKKK